MRRLERARLGLPAVWQKTVGEFCFQFDGRVFIMHYHPYKDGEKKNQFIACVLTILN